MKQHAAETNAALKGKDHNTSTMRNYSLDAMRSLAMLAVVSMHVNPFVFSDNKVSETQWWTANIFSALGQWCVPLFFLISGALLLRDPLAFDIKHFYQKRFTRLAPIILFWTVFYCFVKSGYSFDIDVLYRMVILGWTHLWFLYVLIGFYFATPLIVTCIKSLQRKQLIYMIIICFTTAAGYSFLMRGLHLRSGFTMFEWPLYLGYFLSGYYFVSYPVNDSRKPKLLIAAIGLTIILALTNAGLAHLTTKKYSYATLMHGLNPIIILQSLCIFAIMYRDIDLHVKTRWHGVYYYIAVIGQYALGIYVTHSYILNISRRLPIGPSSIGMFFGLSLMTLFTFLASLCVVLVLSRIVYIKKTVI